MTLVVTRFRFDDESGAAIESFRDFLADFRRNRTSLRDPEPGSPVDLSMVARGASNGATKQMFGRGRCLKPGTVRPVKPIFSRVFAAAFNMRPGAPRATGCRSGSGD